MRPRINTEFSKQFSKRGWLKITHQNNRLKDSIHTKEVNPKCINIENVSLTYF